QRLAELAVDLCLRREVLATAPFPPGYRVAAMHGPIKSVLVWPINGESAWSTFAHEFAHVTRAEADGRQVRHIVDGKSEKSPLSEVGAWRGAIELSPAWTREMQDDCEAAIETYRSAAIDVDENVAIADLISYGRSCVRP